MRICIRTFWFVVLIVVLDSCSASAQARKWQLPPPQNGGPAAAYRRATNGQKQLDPNQSQKQLDPNQSRYTWLELDPLGTGAGFCYADAHALNDWDQVVVDWTDPNDCNILHASLWDKGKWKLLDYPVDPNCAEPASYLTSITNWGFAFGTYWSACPYEPAGGVDVKNRKWYFLPDIPGYPYNQGFSMNDSGLAVGVDANRDNTVFQHWIWDGHKYVFLTFPDDWDVNTWWAGPLSINNWGQIAGEYFDTTVGYERAYMQEGAKTTILDAPGNPDGGTYANGINNEGYVLIGALYDQGSPYYPSASFVYRKGVYTKLPTPPYDDMTLWFIFNVNDRGDMIGRWWDSNNNIHTFIAFRH